MKLKSKNTKGASISFEKVEQTDSDLYTLCFAQSNTNYSRVSQSKGEAVNIVGGPQSIEDFFVRVEHLMSLGVDLDETFEFFVGHSIKVSIDSESEVLGFQVENAHQDGQGAYVYLKIPNSEFSQFVNVFREILP